MKRKFILRPVIFVLALLSTSLLHAQSVAINTDGTTAHASALLDIKSSTKGMLVPRMTSLQRAAIATPAAGLLVYDTNTNSYWYYNGTTWNVLSTGASTNFWSLNGSDIYNNTAGNVGIGTVAPYAYGHGGNNKMMEISNTNTGSNIQSHLILSTNGTSGSAGGITWASQNVVGAEKRLGFIGDVYESNNVAARMVFYTRNDAGDLGERLTVLGNGNLGIGTVSPGNYKLKISSSAFGLDIENSITLSDWEFFTASNGELILFFNNLSKGVFNPTTGAYSALSDERLKTNIRPMSSTLEKIKQLKPSTYQFKNTTNKQEYNGFIAQDVMKLFPSLVVHNVNPERKLDVYTMDYSGFGVIAIKGIQELQPIIEEQKLKIETLEERIAKLEAALASIPVK